MRIAFSILVLMYAYAWQNIEMAILGVGFVWLGHFIAFTFYPQIATIRSEGRSPKIFEAITLLVSYSIAFFLVTITSWLIDAFDIRSSPLQAARDQPCSQHLYTGCYEVMMIDNLAPLFLVAFVLVPTIRQFCRKRASAPGPAPRWPIAAGIGGGLIAGFALSATWNGYILPPNSGRISAILFARFGVDFEVLALGLSIWLQALRADEYRRFDAAQAYRWGLYGLIFGCILGVSMIIAVPVPSDDAGWIMILPLLYAAVLVYPLLRIEPRGVLVALGSHVMLVLGVGILQGIPAAMKQPDVFSLFVALIGLPLLPVVCIAFYRLVKYQKTWLSKDIEMLGFGFATDR